MKPLIWLEHIKKYYHMGDNVVKALDDVSLTIEEHEFVAIIGPSGSGKSTLMNIIGCLDITDSGEYFLDQVNVSQSKDNKLAIIRNNKIGFIFQSFNLLNKLNALENVELPMIYQGIGGGERKRKALSALESVGLGARSHHRPNELSGGQQQRVAIARALVTEPPLILADEPTGNLDSRSGKDVLELLKELHRNGNTIVLITHDNNVAMQAPRQVRIMDGQIVEDTRTGSLVPAGDAR